MNEHTEKKHAHNWKGNKYLGVSNTMHNGMKATIVAYENNLNIDVQFEDGTITYNKSIHCFKNGYIKYPKQFEHLYLGMTKTMHNGMKTTIIEYRSYKDVDVLFEDGTVVQHVKINDFKKREIYKNELDYFTHNGDNLFRLYLEFTSACEILANLMPNLPYKYISTINEIYTNIDLPTGVLNCMIIKGFKENNNVLPSFSYFQKMSKIWIANKIFTTTDAIRYSTRKKGGE